MYPVTIVTGLPWASPLAREGQGLGWFDSIEMRRLTLAPANNRAFDAIYAFLTAPL